MSALRYRRILLKLSGEALAPENGFGIDPHEADKVVVQIRKLRDLGVQVALVVGGGNMWRGIDGLAHGMERATADHMGMLATVMNALALADALRRGGIDPRVMTAITMTAVAEPYIRGRAIRHLEKGRTILLAAGTGNPFFTTDTAAALRAVEINAELLVKATKVDGVYDKDPKRNPDAKRYERLSYSEALVSRLGVMDSTAFSLCMDNDMPIIVLDLWQPGNLEKAVLGQPVGTLVSA
ncbi:MAG: UMP kinase [Anaerolineae bacterium]|jgi:uridylate kinase|nr:UMP kinase [Anaerolineae bacterium]